MNRILVSAPTVVAGLVLAGGGWLLFVPAQLGGAMRYAVVDGASMEPGLRRGDLVVVRPDREPDVGDAVLYHDPALGVRVLHRVVAREGERLVLRGDANDFLDDVRPRPAEVSGSLWFSIPRVGLALIWLQQPLHAALLAFGLAVFALTGGGTARAARSEAVAAGK